MQIQDGHVVTIEYTLRDAEGAELESSKAGGAITFELGKDRMLPGLAAVLEGMSVGETRTGVIPPGELVPREVTAHRVVRQDEFPEGKAPGVGDRFQAKGLDGHPLLFEVIEINDGAYTVDLLHPLHEVEVHYEVTVIAARRAGLPPPPPMDDVEELDADLLEDEDED